MAAEGRGTAAQARDALRRCGERVQHRLRQGPRRLRASHLGETGEVALEADGLAVPDRVGLARLAAAHRGLYPRDEVVDVGRQHRPVALPGKRHLAAAQQLGGAGGPWHRARPVDVAGADDHRAAARGYAIRGALCVEVGDADRAVKRGFVLLAGGLVAVDDHRAQVHDALGSRGLSAVEDVDRAPDVDVDEVPHRAPLAHVGRGVHDQLGALERRDGRVVVADVGDARLGTRGADALVERLRDLDPDHLARSGLEERTGDRRPDEPPGAGHGSAPSANLNLGAHVARVIGPRLILARPPSGPPVRWST